MQHWINRCRDHLNQQGESYLSHMWGATKLVLLLLSLSVKCLIHSILPCFFTTAVSDSVDKLAKMSRRAK